MEAEQDPRGLVAAAFLAQALGLEDDPGQIAAELTTVKRDPHAAVFSAELDSSVGPAAFLVYAYAFGERDGAGREGRTHFERGLATLEQAAARGAPGPRVVAHAATETDGLILATTPATYRALTGDPDSTAVHRPPVGDPDQTRREAAGDLLSLLRAANAQATTWLAAMEADATEQLTFNDAETELALYLLDERSIQDLLRVLNVLMTPARQEATQGTEP